MTITIRYLSAGSGKQVKMKKLPGVNNISTRWNRSVIQLKNQWEIVSFEEKKEERALEEEKSLKNLVVLRNGPTERGNKNETQIYNHRNFKRLEM